MKVGGRLHISVLTSALSWDGAAFMARRVGKAG